MTTEAQIDKALDALFGEAQPGRFEADLLPHQHEFRLVGRLAKEHRKEIVEEYHARHGKMIEGRIPWRSLLDVVFFVLGRVFPLLSPLFALVRLLVLPLFKQTKATLAFEGIVLEDGDEATA